jgi:hypothetical protein
MAPQAHLEVLLTGKVWNTPSAPDPLKPRIDSPGQNATHPSEPGGSAISRAGWRPAPRPPVLIDAAPIPSRGLPLPHGNGTRPKPLAIPLTQRSSESESHFLKPSGGPEHSPCPALGGA